MRWFHGAGVGLILLPALAMDREFGIHPDCTEKKTTYERLVELATDQETAGFEDFLKRIPTGTLQTFTFITKTRSFQHHKTSAEWPRVLRMSADGKLVLSYVCHPESQDYGKIEMLRFDDATRSFAASTFDFQPEQPSFRGVSLAQFLPELGKRVIENPRTCAKCHSTHPTDPNPDLRALIASYPDWRGHYGSSDDSLIVGTDEREQFQAFVKRIFAEKITCYTSLPWPNEFTGDYALYPYHSFEKLETPGPQYSKPSNYHIRPNLKFNDSLSHLMAQRLARKIEQIPEYHRVKYLLMMEAAGCADFDPERELPALGLPVAIATAEDEPLATGHPLSVETHTRQLYGLSRFWRLEDADWTMHFNRPTDPYFLTGVGGETRDITMGELAQGELLRGIARNAPEVWSYVSLSRGVGAAFASQDFSCVDDLGGQILVKSPEHRAQFCQLMRAHHVQALAHTDPPGDPLPKLPHYTLSDEQARELTRLLGERFGPSTDETVASGEAVVQHVCAQCHGRSEEVLPPNTYGFLASRGHLEKALREDALLTFQLLTYLETRRMPKGSSLPPEEIHSVQAYVLRLASQIWRSPN